MNKCEQLVLNLYQRRTERDSAKAELVGLSDKIGKCEPESNGYGHLPCYGVNNLDEFDWCEICQTKQPVWRKYREAAVAAGVALRKVIALGKKLELDHD